MTYPLGRDPLEGKPCLTCPDYGTNCAVGCDREGDGHDSDCATHNAPAYPNAECDCSLCDDVTQYNPWRAHIYAVMEGGSYFGAQDWIDLLAYMDSEHKKIINLDDQVRQISSMVRQYETALRIKNEEHSCCAEDLIDARKDSERLDWLMRNVSGKEFRRLGVTYNNNYNHNQINTTIKINTNNTAKPPTPTGWSDTDWLKHLQGQHPLSGLHINQGSMDAAADAYEAEYNARHNAC